MVSRNLDIPMNRMEAFCRKWKIRELSLFGSVLRDDFRPDSDVDVLVSFECDAPWDLFHLVEMRDELIALFGRDVGLVKAAGRCLFVLLFAPSLKNLRQSVKPAANWFWPQAVVRPAS